MALNQGRAVASCIIDDADGQKRQVALVYGRDIMTRLLEEDPVPRERPVVAWCHDAGGGYQFPANFCLSYFRTSWTSAEYN